MPVRQMAIAVVLQLSFCVVDADFTKTACTIYICYLILLLLLLSLLAYMNTSYCF